MTETNATTAQDEAASEGWTEAEKAAMKEHAAELKAAKRRGRGAEKAAAEARDVEAAIAAMEEPDRLLAERVHAIVTAAAPGLAPKLWYGMPAYARDGKIVCFFQAAQKFKSRYATLGFNDAATLDDGAMWPTAFALTAVGDTEERAIEALVRRGVG